LLAPRGPQQWDPNPAEKRYVRGVNRDALEKLSRNDLIAKASSIGVARAEVMTRMELVDEIVRRSYTDEQQRRRARGWLGVARDLVASLIDQGLNMSEAAELVRTGGARPTVLRHQAPVATVTLAEIYASQGHVKRASSMLDEVLRKEPDHQFARALRDRLPGGKPAEALETSAAPASEPPLSDTEPPSAPASEPPLSDTVPPSARPERAEFSEVAPHAQRSPEPIAAESNATPPSPDGDEDADTPRAPPVVPARADLPAETTRSEVRTPAVTPFVPSSDVLLIKRSAATEVSVYWELVPAHAMETVVRLVAFVPDWAGAQRVEHQLSALGAVGTASVQVPEGAIVRAVIGSQLGGVFRPLAVGVEIRGSERPEVAWAPSPVFQERIAPALDRAFAALA
jgi:hypothetical protein